MYAQARENQIEYRVSQLVDLADEADTSSMAAVTKARLQIDTRKWEAAKILPKIYGDKLELGGNIGLSALIEAVHAKLPAPDDGPLLEHDDVAPQHDGEDPPDVVGR